MRHLDNLVGCRAIRLAGVVIALAVSTAPAAPAGHIPDGMSAVESAEVRLRTASLHRRLQALRDRQTGRPDRFGDADLFLKAVTWAIDYEEQLTPADIAQLRRGLERGAARIGALEAGRSPWEGRRGRLVRGYISAVDGSTQPYGLIVPASYDSSRPMRLDVVLHGSTRPVGMSELRFALPFDGGDDGGPPVRQDWLELRPLGRVENCYRWAGETDVFEAIEDVCRSYRVDRDRIVLRGMSMGASGTWHLGLKHPDRFVALGPYCGYVDTHQFSLSPIAGFVKVGPLPEHQERALHMLDSVDYAANAGMIPAIGAMGEKDPFFQAHVIMSRAMEREGLKMVNLISPGTAHVQDPTTFQEQLRRIEQHVSPGLDRAPRDIRFVTWTLKYARCHWVELKGLCRHYERAEIRAHMEGDGSVRLEPPVNITGLLLRPPALQGDGARLLVAGRLVPLPRRRERGVLLQRERAGWRASPGSAEANLSGKLPGLQGPIDDAFTAPFLCVRGTGTAWNPRPGAWAEASLDRFAAEWRRFFRGDLPIKDDTAVTPEDLRRYHLILFGDPGSNPWIRRALPRLPVRWSRGRLQLGGKTYDARTHAPALITASPLPGASGKYLVLNSGHTFHEAELNLLNYLLFPRLGDWAVMRLGSSRPTDEQAVAAGYFDEDWRSAGATDAR